MRESKSGAIPEVSEPGSRKISERNLSETDSLMLFVPREKQCLRTVSEGVEKVA